MVKRAILRVFGGLSILSALVKPIIWIIERAGDVEFVMEYWPNVLKVFIEPWFPFIALVIGLGILYFTLKPRRIPSALSSNGLSSGIQPIVIPREGKANLELEVQSCVVLDWLPFDRHNALANTSMCTFAVKVKFSPTGEVKIDAVKLHLGRHSYDADSIPIIILNQEGIYEIGFKVHNWVITPLFKGKSIQAPYIRVISGEQDWRSSTLPISFGFED